GSLYIAAVLSAVPVRHPRAIAITAGICSVLVLASWFISPRQLPTQEWAIVNKALVLGVIWAAAGMADVWRRFQEQQQKQMQETQLLHQATALSASQSSFREALKNSLKTLCDIVGWPAGHVYVRDGGGHHLVATDVWHVAERGAFELLQVATRGLRFSQGQGAAGQAWKTGQPIVISDVSQSDDYRWLKEPERLGVVGAFLLPVTIEGKVVAVMEFFSERPLHIDSEFMPLARSFGEQLGRLFERRKAEHALRQSEERLRLALWGGCIGTWEWHMDTGQVTWSPELEEIHGLAPGTFEGTLEALRREVHPEDRQRVAAAIEQVLQQGGEYRVEYRMARPDGRVQWLEGRGAVHTEPDGQSRRLVGVCMNITERKQYEEQNARLAAIVQSSDDAILSKSLDGTILSWNPGAERTYGYRAEEVVGKPVFLLAPPDRQDDFPAIMERVSRGERIEHYETVRKRKDGQLIDIWLSISPIKNPQGEVIGAAAVARDITERKKAERQMQEAREAAEAANRMQSRFLANMSHELRTPMNSILGMLQLALSDSLSSEMRSWLNTAKSSADSLLVLLNDLLDVSKIDAGKLTIESEPFSLRESLDETIRSLAPKAFEKGLELVCDVEPNVPDRLVGDVFRVRQILTNLVTNAVKFTDQGEVIVTVGGQAGQDVAPLLFAVSDTGNGIPLDDQSRIFEPFIQSEAAVENHQGGAGLGLSICRELVRHMGGKLKVTSAPGLGSRFWFSLPLAVAEDGAARDDDAEAVRQLRGQPVLIVDKNRASRELLTKVLSRWEMRPDIGVDGDHALGKLYRAETESRGFRVMVVDAETVGSNCWFLPRRMAESLDEVPAVVLMTHPGKERWEAGDPGRHRNLVCLEKPISAGRLLAAIRRALGLAFSAADPVPSSPLSEVASRPLSVLLAEDTPANQEVVRSVLQRRGHRVTVVVNGREATEEVDRQAYDVVLMDITMPIMDGYAATRIIRQRERRGGRRVPILALTAHATMEHRENCAAAGMDGYLAKPIDVGQLIELVERTSQAGSRFQRLDSSSSGDKTRYSAGHVGSERLAMVVDEEAGPARDRTPDAIIDYHGALERLGGDEDLFRDVVRLFDQDIPGLLQRIRTCIEEADAEKLQRAAHSLRGLAANFGARDAAGRALCLEQMGKSRCLEGAANLAEELECEIAQLNRALSPYREPRVAEHEAPMA
ncbi:MAG: PAS domain S-box protein, partial [Thermoguttaceae bacterium]